MSAPNGAKPCHSSSTCKTPHQNELSYKGQDEQCCKSAWQCLLHHGSTPCQSSSTSPILILRQAINNLNWSVLLVSKALILQSNAHHSRVYMAGGYSTFRSAVALPNTRVRSQPGVSDEVLMLIMEGNMNCNSKLIRWAAHKRPLC